uniref:YqaJ viral recombinase domain-containing protein n=1 Tax=Panagrolaimus davidi TaxID=227884 RepID=A0A914P8B5_9BILA
MLFLRFDLLSFYTHKIEDNSFITNCNTLKALAKGSNCSFVMFKAKKIVNSISKTFYILHAEDHPKFIPTGKIKQNIHAQKCLEATLKSEIDEYHIFGCYHKSLNVGKSSVNIYYTHQIDLLDNEMNPIEVKALYLPANSRKTLRQKLSEYDIGINTLLQCRIGKIGKVIFGLHDNVDARLIQMNLTHSDMEKCFKCDIEEVKRKVDSRLAKMQQRLQNIIAKYWEKNFEAVRIRLNETNEWMFEEINLEKLLETYNQL